MPKVWRTLWELRDAWHHDILPWWRSDDRKPLGRQIRELCAACRAYHRVPWQYFRYKAYREGVDDPQAYLPRRCLMRARKALNSGADWQLARNKRRFRAAMEAAGLPVLRELFTIGEDGSTTDADDRALSRAEANALIHGCGRDLFVKPLDGAFGVDARVLRPEQGLEGLFDGRSWIVQPRLEQHPQLSELYPDSINTVRINTLRLGEKVEIFAAILRLGVGGSTVDNAGLGGLSAPIDIDTGQICGPALHTLQFDISQTPYRRHPDTGRPILGVQLPFWDDLRKLVRTAARSCGKLRTIGWDVVLAPEGPILLEANQNWDPYLMQMHWPMRDTPFGREAVAPCVRSRRGVRFDPDVRRARGK